MAEYRLTNKAVEDLNGIWEYTFDYWSEEQADKYYSMLLEFFQAIADNPDSGKNYDGIVTGISGLRAHRHPSSIPILNPALNGTCDLWSGA